jgi:hypothetical protein
MYLPIVLNSWPMKLLGVQLARADFAAALADPHELACRPVLVRGEHHTEGGEHGIEGGVGKRQVFGVGFPELDRMALGLRAGAAGLEQRGYIVGRRNLAPAPRGGERGIAVASRDVEHAAARAQIERLAKVLADDLQSRACDGIVSRGPGGWRALTAARSTNGGKAGITADIGLLLAA